MSAKQSVTQSESCWHPAQGAQAQEGGRGTTDTHQDQTGQTRLRQGGAHTDKGAKWLGAGVSSRAGGIGGSQKREGTGQVRDSRGSRARDPWLPQAPALTPVPTALV